MKAWHAGILAAIAFILGIFLKSRKSPERSLVETQREIAETASEQAEAVTEAAQKAHSVTIRETKKTATKIENADRSRLAEMVSRVFGGGS